VRIVEPGRDQAASCIDYLWLTPAALMNLPVGTDRQDSLPLNGDRRDTSRSAKDATVDDQHAGSGLVIAFANSKSMNPIAVRVGLRP